MIKIKKNRVYKGFFRRKEEHQSHLVDSGQISTLVSFFVLLIILSLNFYCHLSIISRVTRFDPSVMHIYLIFFSFIVVCWFISVIIEPKQGRHTNTIRISKKRSWVRKIKKRKCRNSY